MILITDCTLADTTKEVIRREIERSDGQDLVQSTAQNVRPADEL